MKYLKISFLPWQTPLKSFFAFLDCAHTEGKKWSLGVGRGGICFQKKLKVVKVEG